MDLTDAGRSVVGRMDAEFVRAYVTTFTGLNLDTITAAERHLQSLLDELEPLSPPVRSIHDHPFHCRARRAH
ncbi:hypothetical protein [Deinococcus multiflagellatus]|uniref:MarR family transcriptional regulator n=1 Tax=Deinococcus multiflagellatus TaxID=1656887 RepID=A0ABW1ZHF9_9DEIO